MGNRKFLDNDHLVSLDALVKVINQEIQWCYQNSIPESVTPEFSQGFINGLEQAKYLIIKATEIIGSREVAAMGTEVSHE